MKRGRGYGSTGLQLGAVSPREVCSSRVEDGGVRTERVEDGGVAEDDVGCVGRWAVVMLLVSMLIQRVVASSSVAPACLLLAWLLPVCFSIRGDMFALVLSLAPCSGACCCPRPLLPCR